MHVGKSHETCSTLHLPPHGDNFDRLSVSSWPIRPRPQIEKLFQDSRSRMHRTVIAGPHEISAWADDLGFHRPQAVQAPPPFDSLTLRQSASLSLRPAPFVESLFNSCRMPLTGIDEQAYEDAAKQLEVEMAVIKAVANVETKSSAFDKEGRPTILYERHYFHRLTQGRFSKKIRTSRIRHPGATESSRLSTPSWRRPTSSHRMRR